MLPTYGTVVSLILITPTLITAIDYEDNDLAKVCRPLDRQLDLLFILDGSGSVSGNTFATQMAMLNKIVDMIEIGPKNTQIAVMQYSSYTRVEFNFSANPLFSAKQRLNSRSEGTLEMKPYFYGIMIKNRRNYNQLSNEMDFYILYR
uniref:VWFA domain-containing protein n=1 Tax=Loa loa TaxID=7209 RepID=A0A1I7VM29_LOALO